MRNGPLSSLREGCCVVEGIDGMDPWETHVYKLDWQRKNDHVKRQQTDYSLLVFVFRFFNQHTYVLITQNKL